jgi:hypothetical protein
MKSKSKDYIKGFKHGIAWTLMMDKCEFAQFHKNGKIKLKEYAILQTHLDKIALESKEAVQSLKEGR